MNKKHTAVLRGGRSKNSSSQHSVSRGGKGGYIQPRTFVPMHAKNRDKRNNFSPGSQQEPGQNLQSRLVASVGTKVGPFIPVRRQNRDKRLATAKAQRTDRCARPFCPGSSHEPGLNSFLHRTQKLAETKAKIGFKLKVCSLLV